MRTVTSADGTRIAYERHGDGRPLLLLHGGLTRRYWDPVVPEFADDYAVFTPDRRGRGESGDREAYGIDREVADVRALIDAVEGEPVLFGHSFGGRMAVEAARVEPVAGVVAYEPAYLVDEYRKEADLAARMAARLDAGEPREAARLHVREVIHGGEIDDLDAWLDGWPPWPAPVEHVENTLRMNRAIEEQPLPDSLDVGAPTLLLTGSEGPEHLRESVRAVNEALPSGRLVEFEGIGHGGPAESPERVAATVRRFLAEVAPPRTG
ncbi:alpha/beta fold hydrolase [Haloplanus halophilus]|uniref:alpha/beta fold hydrolase n=1 Tax=Haloplanus halophilus TaxID=2949993 RepID=UPI00203D7A7D|nr:alpha/beta hydrolase [Haloplanus sp. GDY1]